MANHASSIEGRGELGTLLRAVVETALAERRVAPELYRVLAEELPRAARRTAPDPSAVQERMREWLAPHLTWHPDPELALFVARTALHAAVHEAAIERPELLNQPAFVDELVRLLERYLGPP